MPEHPLTPLTRRALMIALSRQNDAGYFRSRDLGVKAEAIDEIESLGWLKRINDLPHPERAFQLTKLGQSQLWPPEMSAILRDDVSGDSNLTFRPDPEDDALLIGSNGHRYAANRPPSSGWQNQAAYELLDQLTPEALPVNMRMLLGGLIAALVDDVARQVARKYVKPN